MKEIKNMGYIYKITNLVNRKVYIGQTTQTIESRWREHKKCSKLNSKMGYTLYRAMNKYGLDNFTIEEIEKCEIDKLNEREVYWIDFYDSFNSDKGYNLTLGGGGKKVHNLDENLVLKQFEELDNVTEVAKIYGCASNVISEILNKHKIHIKSSIERGFSVDRYSLDGKFLEHYQTLHEAAIWIKNNCEKAKEKNSINISYSLKNHICKEKIFYDFIWKSNDISEENKLDRLNKLKENKMNKKIICPICNKNFKNKESISCKSCFKKENIKSKKYIEEKSLNKNIVIKNNRCIICNTTINRRSTYCKDCFLEKSNKIKKEEALEQLENKIPKETLMQLVRKKSFTEIGNIYGVSDNTIRKWCKNYYIPFRKEDIVNISQENWNKECNLSEKEYKNKYLNTKKEKSIINDQEIIDKYLEIKNLTYLEKFFHKDERTIKKILIDNGIDLSDIVSKKILKVQKLNATTLEILQEYSSINETIQYIIDNNLCTTSNFDSIRGIISKANANNKKAYGYRWKFIYEE